MKKYYWKVMRVKDDGKITSAVIWIGKYCIEYKPGEVAEETLYGNGILVFDTRKNARLFRNKEKMPGRKLSIFKVENMGEERHPFFYDVYYLIDGVIEKSEREFPKGTLAFSKIKVIGKSR